MDYRSLAITVISADDLKDVNLMSKMDVYVAVSLSGDLRAAQTTPVHKDAGKSPRWNHALSLPVYESAIKGSNVSVVFRIVSDRVMGDKEIGRVTVPIRELFDAAGDGDRVVEYKVHTVSGKTKGTLKFSYKFGDKISPPAPPAYAAAPPAYTAAPPHYAAAPPPYADKGNSSSEPVTAYPPPHYATGYPPQPYAQPPQMGYGYPPPQQGYGYPQAPGYGPPGYGGYGVVPPKKKKQGMGGLGLGLGAGLLGGLLVGDMISDVGDSGFDDGGGFDF